LRVKDRHSGKVAAILGGGPSLHKDLKRVPSGAIFFAVNHYDADIETDYTVYNDRHTFEFIKPSNSVTLSRFPESDVQMPYETGVLSIILAARTAREMGCAPILLCGCDCTGNHAKQDVDIDWYLDKWRKENLEDIRAVSGPLQQLFGRVRRKIEPFPEKIRVNITKNQTVVLNKRQSVNFVRGVHDLPRHLAKAALAAGIAIKEK